MKNTVIPDERSEIRNPAIHGNYKTFWIPRWSLSRTGCGAGDDEL